MLTVLTVEDIMEWNRTYKSNRNGFADIYKRSEADKMYGSFHLLINYYFFKENCLAALKKLKPIAATEFFLQTGEIREWVLFHEWLGSKRLASFLIEYSIDTEHSTLEIARLNIFVELNAFMPIVAFCEIFRILYWEWQLHIPENERVYDKPWKYNLHPPNARVKEWLEKGA